MKKLSAKNKIILLGAAWVVVSAAMLFYFFGILDIQNQATVYSIDEKKKELQTLQVQNESYLRAKSDLKQVALEPLQPEDFFSKDVTLVNELKVLEDLKQKLGVQTQISGISGTVGSAAKAKTVTPVVVIPYGITVSGTLVQVVDFIETLENLSFITNVSNIGITSLDNGKVNATMSASFYLTK